MNVDELIHNGIKASICDDLDMAIQHYERLRRQILSHIEHHGKIVKCPVR